MDTEKVRFSELLLLFKVNFVQCICWPDVAEPQSVKKVEHPRLLYKIPNFCSTNAHARAEVQLAKTLSSASHGAWVEITERSSVFLFICKFFFCAPGCFYYKKGFYATLFIT